MAALAPAASKKAFAAKLCLLMIMSLVIIRTLYGMRNVTREKNSCQSSFGNEIRR